MRRTARRLRGGRAALLAATLLLAVLPACGQGGGGEARGEDATGNETGEEPEQRTPPSGTAWVIFDADTVEAELAVTSEERSEGLKFRDHLAADAGMLFVFEEEDHRSFWMKDTYIPLSIAFMNDDWVVVDIRDMEPLNEEYTLSSDPASLALEVNQGWFDEHGVVEGDTAGIVFGSR